MKLRCTQWSKAGLVVWLVARLACLAHTFKVLGLNPPALFIYQRTDTESKLRNSDLAIQKLYKKPACHDVYLNPSLIPPNQ